MFSLVFTDMATKVHTSRLLIRQAAKSLDDKDPTAAFFFCLPAATGKGTVMVLFHLMVVCALGGQRVARPPPCGRKTGVSHMSLFPWLWLLVRRRYSFLCLQVACQGKHPSHALLGRVLKCGAAPSDSGTRSKARIWLSS